MHSHLHEEKRLHQEKDNGARNTLQDQSLRGLFQVRRSGQDVAGEFERSERGRRIRGNLGERVKKDEEEIGGAKKVELKKGLLGCDYDWLSGLSAEELMIFLGKLEVKIESVMDKIGFLKMADERNRAPSYGFEMMNSEIAKNNVEIASSLACQKILSN